MTFYSDGGKTRFVYNLNEYLPFDVIEGYANQIKKTGTDRTQKSSKDTITGRLAEEVLIYLLSKYFEHNKLIFKITRGEDEKALSGTFKIVNEKLNHEKHFDIDIIINNPKRANRYFLVSCKGTARERIGQFLSNLFLMDDRLIKEKYSDRYYLDFSRKGTRIMYAFVCYDWAVQKDFNKYTKTGAIRKTLKQTEVLLINDEDYISGGIAVINNVENIAGVMNFGELVGRIANFLN